MGTIAKILLVNHFRLQTVCGTTVMFDEILRLAPVAAPSVRFVYESQDFYPTAKDFRRRLEEAHADASCVVAINAHIEVYWPLSETLFEWAKARHLPAYLYIHDYWPHHREGLLALVGLGAKAIASTPFIAELVGHYDVIAEVIDVGVPLPDRDSGVGEPAAPAIVASAGRLVPRKRFADIVRAFAVANVDHEARLYLRVLPSNVFDDAADTVQLAEIEAEIDRLRLRNVTLDRQPADRPAYRDFATYVCSSSYEGFSMAVIESAFEGCPPLMSDIPPHQRIAQALFGAEAGQFLFPTGDAAALGRLVQDEIRTRHRKAFVMRHQAQIRRTISERWSLATTARALASLAHRHG